MKSLDNIVKQLISDNNLEDTSLLIKISEIWTERFQKSFENNISILNFRNKTLFLKTNSPVWRKEVTLLQDKIINHINTKLGSTLIEKIIVY